MTLPPRPQRHSSFINHWVSSFLPKTALLLLLGVAACGESPVINVDGGRDDDGGDDSGSLDGGDDGPSIDGGGGQGTDSGEPEPVLYTCGDGKLEPGEFCDDGNTEDDDGCSADCLTQDPDFDCSAPGEDCVRVVICGNGILEGSEACDDGNTGGGDGCSADCREVEEGWSCGRPGVSCIQIPVCGNGVRERGEECDSGQQSDPGVARRTA